jgi:hypothetical protein
LIPKSWTKRTGGFLILLSFFKKPEPVSSSAILKSFKELAEGYKLLPELNTHPRTGLDGRQSWHIPNWVKADKKIQILRASPPVGM